MQGSARRRGAAATTAVALVATGLHVQESYVAGGRVLRLLLVNGNSAAVGVLVTDAYSRRRFEVTLQADQTRTTDVPLGATRGWYDLTITVPSVSSFGVQLAGHVENGFESITGPLIGGA